MSIKESDSKKNYSNAHPKSKNVKVARSYGMNKRRQKFYDAIEMADEKSLSYDGVGISEEAIKKIRLKILGRSD